MDKCGIGLSILSLQNPAVQAVPDAVAGGANQMVRTRAFSFRWIGSKISPSDSSAVTPSNGKSLFSPKMTVAAPRRFL
jgi:hypothetical protein